MATSNELTEIGFIKIGNWLFDENQGIKYELITGHEDRMIIPNSLYAMVKNADNEDGGEIMYIGKTTKTLKNRFAFYRNPGATQQTNIKVKNRIIESLNIGDSIHIFSFSSLDNLCWGSYNINLAAGLEDALVQTLKPKWNGNQNLSFVTSTSEIESDVESDLSEPSDKIILSRFNVNLLTAAYEQGFINPGRAVDHLLGSHDSIMKMTIGDRVFETRINRTANSNGTVRLYFGQPYAEIIRANFQYADVISFAIFGPGEIKLITPLTTL